MDCSADTVAHNADLERVPFVAVLIMIVIAPEVPEGEQQPFHSRIVKKRFAPRADRGQVLLVHHLVGLDVETPVARALRKGDVGLLAVNAALEGIAVGPFGVDDFDFGRPNLLNEAAGAVAGVAFAHGNNEFVAYRKYGPNRLRNWIAQRVRVSCK